MALKRKVWNDGEIWTPEDALDYLMNQVDVVADTSADLAAIPSPIEGMSAWIKDINMRLTYDGSDWGNFTTQKYKIGSVSCPSSTGNFSVTGVGFKPKLIKLRVAAGNGTIIRHNQGAADANNQWVDSIAARVSSPVGMHQQTSTSHCVRGDGVSTGGVLGNEVLGTRVSLDNDGFTLNFTATLSAYTLFWEAYG